MNISPPAAAVAASERTLPAPPPPPSTSNNKSSPRKCPWRVSIPPTNAAADVAGLAPHEGGLWLRIPKEDIDVVLRGGGVWVGCAGVDTGWMDYYYYYYYEMNRKLRPTTIMEWFLWIPVSSRSSPRDRQTDRQTAEYMCGEEKPPHPIPRGT